MAAKVVRGATSSEWDHVALVIKMSSDPEEVFLYEATGGSGVHMSRFSEKKIFIGNYFHKVVLRRLTWPDKDENIHKLVDFCKQTENAEYSVMSKF